jgi:uncharacterized membrane protein YdjX (TVP38/TMEM64 family)
MGLQESLVAAVDWAQGQGELTGPLIYLALFVICYMACLPCTILEMSAGTRSLHRPTLGHAQRCAVAAGCMFRFERGLVLAIIGKNVANLATTLLAVTVLRQRIRCSISEYPAFRAMEAAVTKGGFMTMVAIRALPCPSFVKAYGLPLLHVPLWWHGAATFVTGFPFAVLWAYTGSLCGSISELGDGREASTPFWAKAVLALLTLSLGGWLALLIRREVHASTKGEPAVAYAQPCRPPRRSRSRADARQSPLRATTAARRSRSRSSRLS